MAIIGDLEEDLINVDPRKHNFSISSSKWTRSSSSSLSPFATSETVTSTAPLVDCAIDPPVPARVDEKDLDLLQGIRLYPKAVTWSVLISLTLVMEGYSTILVPNLFALGPFRKQFGDLQPNEQWEIGAAWQSALVNGGLVGQILGLFAAGVLAEKIGYRQTLMVGLWAMTAFIFVAFFATTKITLLVGQCLMGAPWGLFQCISTVYAADVCPVGLRAYLTTYVLKPLALLHYLDNYSSLTRFSDTSMPAGCSANFSPLSFYAVQWPPLHSGPTAYPLHCNGSSHFPFYSPSTSPLSRPGGWFGSREPRKRKPISAGFATSPKTQMKKTMRRH
jgi:hypothetical protein